MNVHYEPQAYIDYLGIYLVTVLIKYVSKYNHVRAHGVVGSDPTCGAFALSATRDRFHGSWSLADPIPLSPPCTFLSTP